MRAAALSLLAGSQLCLACSGLGNTLIAHHPHSMVESKGAPKLEVGEVDACAGIRAFGAAGALVADQAIEVAVERLVTSVEKEAERYAATYTARASTFLYRRCPLPPRPGQPASYRLREQAKSLTFKRLAEPDGEIAFEFAADLELENDGTVLRILPTKVEVWRTRAKVPWFSWLPWRWPADFVIGSWNLADASIRDIDFNLSISLEAIAVSKGVVRSVRVGPYDIPLGRHDIRGAPILSLSGVGLDKHASPFMALPVTQVPFGLPVNITVSVEEASSLGDPLKRAAERARSEEENLQERVKAWLGVGEEGE